MSRLDEAKARIAAFDALGLEDFAREDVTATRELLDHAVDDLIWAVNELGKFYARSDILESRPDGAQINHGVRTDRVAHHKVAKR